MISTAQAKLRGPAAGWAVHFAGDQKIKWALDEDLRWARHALDGDLAPASVWRSRIVHAAWWPSALLLGAEILRDQKIVCFVDNAPSFYARQPEFHAVRPFVDTWIVRSTQARRQLASLGIQAELAPYCVDPKVFSRLSRQDPALQALRKHLGIPADAYVIGNFHSDTAFTIGPDCPKWQKGPDVFVEILQRVHKAEPHTCVLLAGPRRHWLRRRLRDLGVPVFFAGNELSGDDFGRNILDRTTLNRLYNLLDLYLVCSRWEGGPHSLLEACFSKTKVLSTRVGIAEDLLETVSLFDTIPEAVSRIVDDIRLGMLRPSCQSQYDKVLLRNTPQGFADALRRIYAGFPRQPKRAFREAVSLWLRSHARLLRKRHRPPTVLGMISSGPTGELFEFIHAMLRRSTGFELREKIDARCRHFLIDANCLRSGRRLPEGTLVVVCDHPPADLPATARGVIVPSFEALSGCSLKTVGPLPLVIPPVLDGTHFDANVAVPRQLTSSMAGVTQSIRQLLIVLNSPEDLRWLGFR